MRLYYYTAKQWGMKALWEKRLKIAEYADLNDPFELLPFSQTRADTHIHTQIVEALSNQHGILCFSENWNSSLMWAHYGDKHKGICLGFEIPDGKHLTKIEYQSARLPSPIDLTKPLSGIDENVLATCLNVKHIGWEYEKEYRLRVRLEEIRDGIYYKNFDDILQLREIIIGARSTLSPQDVAEAIGENPEEDVEIWSSRVSLSSFDMQENAEFPRIKILGIDPETKKRHRLAKALRPKNGS